MAREAKFNFEEERRLVDTRKIRHADKYTATVNGKHGYIRFSIDYIRDHALDGAFIKLYADVNKKAIAWKTLRECTNFEELIGYRKIKVYKVKAGKYTTEHCQLGIGSLLKAAGVKDKSYSQLPIKKYKSPSMFDDELSYIELQ